VSIERRIVRLEERRQQAHAAPAAYLVYHGEWAEAVIEGTGERLPYEEFARRYPRHGTLKAYLADEDGACAMEAV